MKRSSEIDLAESWIEVFDQSVAEYLALLYAAFPVRIDLETHEPLLEDLEDTQFVIALPPYTKSHDWLRENKSLIDRDLSGEIPQDNKIAEQGRQYYADIAHYRLGLQNSIDIRKHYENLCEVRSETAHWLVESGYISSEKQRQVTWNTSIRWDTADRLLHGHYAYKGSASYMIFEGARLTSKGLEVLRATPQVLAGKEDPKSLGEQLIDQVKGVAVDAKTAGVRKIVGEIVGVGLKMFTE